MGRSLDSMLQPGERVLYRTDTYRGVVRMLFALMVMIVLSWGVFAALSGLNFGRHWWVIAILLCTMAPAAFGHWLNAGAAVVTDRRLLYDQGPWATLWSRQRLIAVPLTEIAKLTGMKPSWRQAPSLHLTDGRVIGLGNISIPKRLAEAIAAARPSALSDTDHLRGEDGDEE